MTELLKTQNTEPENPGSFNDFCKRENISIHSDAVERYSDALYTFRRHLAQVAGIDLEELHT